MMLGTMRLVVLRAFPLVKGYGANLAVKCDGVLAFVEAQYNLALCSRAARTRSVRGSIPVALPDQRFDTAGQSLASPLSSGVARMLNNNYNLYAALDQPLWQESEGAGGLNAFLRVMGAPGDRNLVDFYFDTGLTYKGPFGREDDTIGIGFAYTRIGGAARSLDADTTATTPAYPVRSRETLLEVSYQFQVTR